MSRHLEPVGAADDGDERVSAYLDGEMDDTDRVQFEADLVADPQLAAELQEIDGTRSALQQLPDVEPRRDLLELGPTGSNARTWAVRGVVAIAAVAAVWALGALVVFSGGDSAIVPALDDLVGQHELAAAQDSSDEFEPMERDEVDMAMNAPDDVGGMAMGGVFQSDDVVQVVYTDGIHNVSVFHQSGEVAWEEMPPGEMMTMDGDQAWHSTMHGSDVVVVNSAEGIVTIVADGEMATDIAEAITA
jgi:hypothetical protein